MTIVEKFEQAQAFADDFWPTLPASTRANPDAVKRMVQLAGLAAGLDGTPLTVAAARAASDALASVEEVHDVRA